MLNRSLEPLHRKLDDAHSMMSQVQSDDEFLALGNYIGNMYSSLICMGDTQAVVDPILCFGTRKKYKKFLKEFDVYSDDLLHHFVLKKDFHSTYIEKILPTVEEGVQQVSKIDCPPEERMSRKKFREVFYAFLDSIQMVDLYRELNGKKCIHASIQGVDDDSYGSTLYNPLSKDIDIFVNNFQYTLNHMNTLVHELGHAYDLKQFDGNTKEYNQYFYLSYYGEVLSRLMERLFHRFLMKNNIMIDSTRNNMANFEDVNQDYLLQGYILSLLDSSFLLSHGFCKCDSEVLTNMIKKYFLEGSNLKDFIEDVHHFDLSDIYTYLYGDILSLFLCAEVEKNGFQNELMDYFMRHRTQPFQEEMLEKNGLNPNVYKKLYKKEIELIQN